MFLWCWHCVFDTALETRSGRSLRKSRLLQADIAGESTTMSIVLSARSDAAVATVWSATYAALWMDIRYTDQKTYTKTMVINFHKLFDFVSGPYKPATKSSLTFVTIKVEHIQFIHSSFNSFVIAKSGRGVWTPFTEHAFNKELHFVASMQVTARIHSRRILCTL